MNEGEQTHTPSRRLRRALRWGSPVLVVGLFLLSSLSVAAAAPLQPTLLGVVGVGSTHTPGLSTDGALSVSAKATATPSAAALAGGGGPTYIENGSGTFFTNAAVQNVTASSPSCATYPLLTFIHECWNATLDPTMNVTTSGYTGLAYTVWTNDSPCAAMSGNATTEIGFETSSNFGTTWGTPQILGNPVCSTDTVGDEHYASAEMPALTSLSNGTFVLAYIESNISHANFYYYYGSYPLDLGCYYTDHDRMVVSDSYTNGATWTTPTVIQQWDANYTTYNGCANTGSTLVRPSITASGNTVYLAYMDYPYYFQDYNNYSVNYEGFLHLEVSTNGGTAWSAASVPPTVGESGGNQYSTIAAYPNLMVTPSGTLYMSYSTAYSEQVDCVSTGGCYYNYNASVMVAWSTNNGSSFASSLVTSDALIQNYYDYSTNFLSGPYSQVGYSPVNGDIFVTFTNGSFGTYCYYYTGGHYCGYDDSQTDVQFASSSNGGANWTTPVSADPGFINPNDGPMNAAYLPSMAVLPDGQIDLTYSATNATTCTPYSIYSYYCGVSEQEFTYSTNNGSSWAQPSLIDDDVADAGCPPCGGGGTEMFSGTTSTVATAGGQVLLAWPNINGQSTYHYAYWGGYGSANVETSQLYTGAGVTVSFTETGLPSGTVWQLSVGGYSRDGPSGSTLSLSGVPPTYSLTYYLPWINTSYGVAWEPIATPSSPGTFSSSATVSVTYSELILLNLQTVPNLYQQYFYGYSNYDMSPYPGAYWMTAGTPFSVTITPTPALYCYPCLNLTFITWVGTGNGSYSGTSLSPTITPTGPVNESATFTLNGYCYLYATPNCQNFTYQQAFVETGLPAGTPWGVTLDSNNTLATVSGSSPSLYDNVSTGVTTFIAWTVPSTTTGFSWVPTTTSPSSFVEPDAPIILNYTLQPVSGTIQDAWVSETGLPNQTAWNFQVGSVVSGTSLPTVLTQITAGGSEVLNATPVYFEDGTGYYLQSITVEPLVINSTSFGVTPGASASIDGPAVIEYNFAPQFLVTTSASDGGSVSLASQWVHSGTTISITALPSPGYHFVSWTGTGTGSVSSGTTATISVKPQAAVNEFAAFRANFPPTWNVTLASSGLPAGTAFTIVVGGTTYTSTTTITIGNFATGAYSVSAPTVFANASNTTQFVPTSVSASSGLSGGILNLSSNVTLTATYETQYALSLFSTPGGSIEGYPSGLYWENAGTTVGLTAVPSSSAYELSGWSGTVSSTSTTISVPINGVANETAQFQVRPIAPPGVYGLTVVETGLPVNTAWSVTAGTTGISGTTSSLTISGLNGTYLVTAATLYGATGVRWVSNLTNASAPVTQNSTVTVGYTEQFQVSVSGTTGGAATTSATSGWTNASSTITLSAVANATSVFMGWAGSGSGSYSGNDTSPTVTVTGPISEQATFAPQSQSAPPNPNSGGSNNNGETTTIAIVVALLVAGLVVGLLVGRRRTQPPASEAPAAWTGPEAPPTEEADPSAAGEPAPAIYDEGSPPN